MVRSDGFTLIELVAVMVIIGLLAATATSTLIPSTSFQLQASRDLIVTAFFSAQQRAMVQEDAIAVITSSNQVDIRQDSNNDGTFAPGESVAVGGVVYPISLLVNQTLSPASFQFNKLGYTSGGLLTLAQSGASVSITVSNTGFTY